MFKTDSTQTRAPSQLSEVLPMMSLKNTSINIDNSPIWSLQSTLSSEWLFPHLSHQREGVTSLAWPTDNDKIFNISSLPRCKSLVMVTSLTSSLFSFPFAFTPLCPWQPIYRSVGRWMSNTATCVHSLMSMTTDLQECWKMDVKHCHMPVRIFPFHFAALLDLREWSVLISSHFSRQWGWEHIYVGLFPLSLLIKM